MPQTIFDIGMYDGSDTAYYLDLGFRVIAVEANPELVARAHQRFATHIADAKLTVVHGAIAEHGGTTDLFLSASDLGSSSTRADWSEVGIRAGTVSVATRTLANLFAEFGVPHFLKVDIEGSDHLCVTALTPSERPVYLSFEAGDDAAALIEHCAAIGYTQFKLIDQMSFRELSRQERQPDRVTARLMREIGYDNRRLVKRRGRWFVRGHSSGPVPWQSDGAWATAGETIRQWHARRNPECWYDVHATTELSGPASPRRGSTRSRRRSLPAPPARPRG